jgi:hypothetical protein
MPILRLYRLQNLRDRFPLVNSCYFFLQEKPVHQATNGILQERKKRWLMLDDRIYVQGD